MTATVTAPMTGLKGPRLVPALAPRSAGSRGCSQASGLLQFQELVLLSQPGGLPPRQSFAAAGGVAGGILGALTEAGVSEEDAQVYAEGVRRGGTLLTVRVPEADQARVEAILDRSAVNIREREMAYRKSGWSSFDPNAPPYTADQVRKERDLYRRNAA